MKKLINLIWVLLLFLPLCLLAKDTKPTINSVDKSLHEIKNVDFINTIKPDQAIKKLQEIYSESKNINYQDGMLESGTYLMIFYYRKGHYEKVIHLASQIEKEVDLQNSTNYYSISKFYRFMALSYIKLGFKKEGITEYRYSINYAEKIKDKEELHFTLAIIYKDLAIYHEHNESHPDSMGVYLFKSLKEIESITDRQKIEKFGGKIFIYNSIAVYYQKLSQPRDTALAKKYFTKAEQIYNTYSPPMLAINEVGFLLSLSNFYLSEKNYVKAIELSKKCLEIEKKTPTNPYNVKYAYEMLAKSYLETGHKELSKEYMHLYASLNDSLNFAERKSVQAPLNRIVDKKVNQSTQSIRTILIITIPALLILSAFIFIKVRKNQKKTRENYEKLIKQLKDKSHAEIKDIPVNANSETVAKFKNSVKISDDTLNQLVFKLNRFEQSLKFLKKDLTLTSLANSLNTNPKYLSEIIKENKNQTFSSYINRLRISYITNKLYEESIYRQYKIKYLAEECGYASPQVFVIAFKKQNGVTPSYYIDQLKNEFPGSR